MDPAFGPNFRISGAGRLTNGWSAGATRYGVDGHRRAGLAQEQGTKNVKGLPADVPAGSPFNRDAKAQTFSSRFSRSHELMTRL